MVWWHHITALGGLNVTALVAVAVALWLGAARCWRLAVAWCVLFGAALLVTAASQIAFLGWGIGIERVSFTGFSGHAMRAAAVFPVAAYLLLELQGRVLRRSAVAIGCGLGLLVAVSRVLVGAHSVSEALAGFLLGSAVALAFIVRARRAERFSPSPLLVVLSLIIMALPRADPAEAHQWLTAAALNLSGHDRPYTRSGWQLARTPYVPACAPEKRRFSYLCT